MCLTKQVRKKCTGATACRPTICTRRQRMQTRDTVATAAAVAAVQQTDSRSFKIDGGLRAAFSRRRSFVGCATRDLAPVKRSRTRVLQRPELTTRARTKFPKLSHMQYFAR